MRQGKAKIHVLRYLARRSRSAFIETHFNVSSPSQSRSQAVVCVSTPRMYLRSGYFLVCDKSLEIAQNHPFTRFYLNSEIVFTFKPWFHFSLVLANERCCRRAKTGCWDGRVLRHSLGFSWGCENAELSRLLGTNTSLLFGRMILGVWRNIF